MTSGVKYGFGRTLPHLAGVILGFGLMIAIVGLGLDILFERCPAGHAGRRRGLHDLAGA
jgi:threonine/homoserine/homoserine lactone efflux protein